MPQPKKWSFAKIKAMSDMYRSGRTLRQIGYAFGVSHQRVHQLMQERSGVEMRSRGKTNNKVYP